MPVKRQAADYAVPVILKSHGRKRHYSCAWVGYLFNSSGAVTVTGTNGVEQHPRPFSFFAVKAAWEPPYR